MPASNVLQDQLRFLGGLITRPRNVGAIAPSGPALARAMAAQVDPHGDLPILELGPGTGVVTAALIERGIAPERITSVEYDPNFAARVAQRFPRVDVVTGDAFDLDRTLGDRLQGKLGAVVSSLPLVNFPEAKRLSILAQAFSRLVPGAPFVQFSYRLRAPVIPPPGIMLRRAAVIWLNVPPARVWVYRRA